MRIYSVLFSAIALATAVLGGGCTASPGAGQPAESGVTIPLTQQLNNNQYRLTANFQITEPDGTVLRVDGTGDVPSVTVQVAPGINQIEVLDGWTLSRSTDGGMTFTPVSAVLATENPINLIVAPNRVTSWEFDFIVRDPNGQVQISFGVVDPPRQLSATLFVTGGFGDFAKYTNTELGLTIYFSGPFPQTSIETDGTHDLQINSGVSSLEFFNDVPGLVTPLGKSFEGGFFTFTTRIHPDGTQDFSASDQGFESTFPEVTFSTGQAFLPSDANGFPADTSFFAFGSPFEISSNGRVILTGSADFVDVFVP